MKYSIILLFLFLASCEKPGIKQETPDNVEFQVSTLFTYDSITIYRFWDNGHPHYFAKDLTITQLNCGKSCYYDETIKTIK